ncbi:MAG: NYN domain-containing protein [Eubacterium sp.]|nr:NYN domain-containing protein [Eubacterium sp.]
MEDKRYAVLIDADNISSKYIGSILDEMTKYGVVTYKRIYGDWTSTQAGKWKKELMENSITPIQQFRNTVGKNATDSTLIIDAMDILYTESVDGFCIVSSDGDFTRLASRLRESGMDVIGMGENKTPRSFRAACSVFTDLELLLDQEDTAKTISSDKKKKKAENVLPQSAIENAIIEIITENDNKGRETGLGEIGSRLQKKYSDFDVRNYGYSSLSTFIEEIRGFDLRKTNSTVTVELKEDKDMKKRLMKYVEEQVRAEGDEGIELGLLGQKLYSEYPQFNAKEFGYATFAKFVLGIRALSIETSENNRVKVYLKEQTEKAEKPQKAGKTGKGRRGKKTQETE